MNTFAEHPSKEQFERYRVKKMAPAELLALDNHIAVCAECRHDFQEIMQCQDAFELFERNLRREPQDFPNHPSLKEIEAFRRDELNEIDREIITGHLEFCPSCAVGIQPNRLQSLWERFTIFRATLFHSIPVQAAGAAALAAILVWVPLHTQVRNLQAQLSELQQSNHMLEQNLQSQLGELRQSNHALQSKYGDAQAQMTSLQNELARQRDKNIALLSRFKNGGPQNSPVDISFAMHEIEVPTEDLRELIEDAKRTRGTGKTIGGDAGNRLIVSLETPISEYVLSSRPTFQWKPVGGASSYSIRIIDENNNRVCRSLAIPGKYQLWKSPATLERGRIYEWYVTAIVDGKKAFSPRAKFKVLGKKKAGELDKAKRDFAHNPLALGYLYAKAGLLHEAEEQLRMLPPDDKNAQKSLQKIRAIRDGIEASHRKQN